MKRIIVLIVALALSACGKAPVVGISSGWTGSKVTVNATYVDAVRKAGGVPVVLPLAANPGEAEALIRRVDAVIMTGGEDVDPARYGETPLNESVEVNGRRDTSDFSIVEAALKLRKPILCICRGEQLMNVALGGSLYQDIPSQAPSEIAHRQDTVSTVPTHIIYLEKDSRLHALTGLDSVMVNSFHHQAVKEPAPGAKVAARAPDGIVEAWEKGNMICVQFHPEALIEGGDDAFLPLFRDLVKRASR